MLIFLYNIFKAFLLFTKFLNFAIDYKIFLNKNKIYYIFLLYKYKVKLYNIFLYFFKLNNSILKIFNTSIINKYNIIYNLKKYYVNSGVIMLLNKFFILNFFNKFKDSLNELIYDKVIFKQFYIKQNFNDLKNDFYDKFINIFFNN